MITRKELAGYSKSVGFSLGQAEKDYLQHIFLASLYSVSATDFVFKGGTALQKVFGLDRFSEGLDFTFQPGQDIGGLVRKSVRSMGNFVESAISKETEKGGSALYKIGVKGPLFDGTEKSTQALTIEISKREKVLLKPTVERVVPIYKDVRAYTLLCMDPREMLAEKVSAVMTRQKARDVYDLWFLLKKNIPIDFGLINGKLSYYGIEFEKQEFVKAVNSKKGFWEGELSPLLLSTPKFDYIAGEVIRVIAEGAEE